MVRVSSNWLEPRALSQSLMVGSLDFGTLFTHNANLRIVHVGRITAAILELTRQKPYVITQQCRRFPRRNQQRRAHLLPHGLQAHRHHFAGTEDGWSRWRKRNACRPRSPRPVRCSPCAGDCRKHGCPRARRFVLAAKEKLLVVE